MPHIDILPEELLAHIATHTDAAAVLSLSQTSRKLRSSCYNNLVFKALILNSQFDLWKVQCLDFGTLEINTGKDVQICARYALADHNAWKLSQKDCPLETPSRFLPWLPELLLVKHPFMFQQCWQRFLREPEQQDARQIFCLAMAVLASDQDMLQLARSLAMNHDSILTKHTDTRAFLWALCSIALLLRLGIKTRLAAWPYNSAAHVPFISLPKTAQIPLRALDSSYTLPLPFMEESDWFKWFGAHSHAMLTSPADGIFNGSWCGYYTYFSRNRHRFDPPMIDIAFNCRGCSGFCGSEGHNQAIGAARNGDDGVVRVEAEDCRDGIGSFSITGTFSLGNAGHVVNFNAVKRYHNSSSLHWECALTPFGIVGFWGFSRTYEPDRSGLLWLWKTKWTEEPS